MALCLFVSLSVTSCCSSKMAKFRHANNSTVFDARDSDEILVCHPQLGHQIYVWQDKIRSFDK